MPPIISVVMPVLNGNLEHLQLAIDSILQQTFTDFEFIIIDDGSNEATKAVLNSYQEKDNRICIITNESNIGIPKSLNKGIRYSKGEIIARHDGDDIAINTRLEQQLNTLNETSGAIGCFTAVKHIDMDGVIISEFPVSEASEILEAELLLNSRLCHPTMFMYKYAIDAVGGYPLTQFAQDYALYTKMIRNEYKFVGLNKPLVHYRISAGGVTQSKRDVQLNIASDIAYHHVRHFLPAIDEIYFKQFWMYIATKGQSPLSTWCFAHNLRLIFYIVRNKALSNIWLPEFKWITSNHYDRRKTLSVFIRLVFFHSLVKTIR